MFAIHEVFLVYRKHSEFRKYIKQYLLLGRGLLLEASLNGELTVAVHECYSNWATAVRVHTL